jgi:hypothetical protein
MLAYRNPFQQGLDKCIIRGQVLEYLSIVTDVDKDCKSIYGYRLLVKADSTLAQACLTVLGVPLTG